MAKKWKPVHPGEVLSEDFMKPYGLSMNKRYDWRVTSRPPHNFGRTCRRNLISKLPKTKTSIKSSVTCVL
jgi:hypothetical protein